MNMAQYWETRYAAGRGSGAGSRGEEAAWKARLLQRVIDHYHVKSLLDLGCGDGHVASRIFVKRYVGYDPSRTAREMCMVLMPEREFTEVPPDGKFDLVVSMDVIFHLVTDELYRNYLSLLFSDRSDIVFVYGTNRDQQGREHVLHRRWLNDVPTGWTVESLPSKFGKDAWLITRG